MRAAVVGVLWALLVVQLAWGWIVFRHQPEVVSIQAGSELPFALAEVTPIASEPPALDGGCRVAFVCSVRCPFCTRLADSIAALDSESLAVEPY